VRKLRATFAAATGVAVLGVFLAATPHEQSPSRLGAVHWLQARPEVATTRPILLAEIFPGGATADAAKLFEHPLIADACESLFTPVLMTPAELPSAPVTLRIVNSSNADLCPPLHDLSIAAVSHWMVAGLCAAGENVPPYLQLLADESAAAGRTQRATFAMGCFWKGEGTIGGVHGVVATKPGFLSGLEVVDAEFDPAVISYGDLLERSRAAGAADRALPRTDEQRRAVANEPRCDAAITADAEPKYYLSLTTYRFVPMTPAQASRVNAALARRDDPNAWLSPRQLRLHQVVIAHPERPWKNAVGADFARAWRDAAMAARVSF